MSRIRLPILLLLLVLAITINGYYHASGSVEYAWIGDVSLNLGTEVIGIILTIVLVDLFLQRHEQKRAARALSIAARQLRGPLTSQLRVLQRMYKAATLGLPHRLPITVDDLFSASFFTEIQHLDFNKQAPIWPANSWFKYLRDEMEQLKKGLESVLDKYASFLDLEDIKLIEDVLNSSYAAFICQAVAIPSASASFGNTVSSWPVLSPPGMDDLTKSFAASLSALINRYNVVCPETKIELDRKHTVVCRCHTRRGDVTCPEIFGPARI